MAHEGGAPDAARRTFANVLWLGGGTDAGKSSIVRALGEHRHFRWYNFDYFEPDHIARMTPQAHPATHDFVARSLDERWVQPSPAALARTTIAMWGERFPLVLEDLREWPRDTIILVEGPGLFPAAVAPLLGSPQQALWLLPTPAFKRAIFATRENKRAIAAATTDPPRAQRNMIARDALVSEHIRREAQAERLAILEVDGSQDVAAMAARVARHFGVLLARAPRR